MLFVNLLNIVFKNVCSGPIAQKLFLISNGGLNGECTISKSFIFYYDHHLEDKFDHFCSFLCNPAQHLSSVNPYFIWTSATFTPDIHISICLANTISNPRLSGINKFCQYRFISVPLSLPPWQQNATPDRPGYQQGCLHFWYNNMLFTIFTPNLELLGHTLNNLWPSCWGAWWCMQNYDDYSIWNWKWDSWQ